MNIQDIHSRIEEFSKIRPDAGTDEAALLEVALFVENIFEVTLTDEEICPNNFGTHGATEQFVLNRLGAM